MKIMVTGGLGFIGSNFIHYMFRKYDEVTILNLDKLSYGSNPNNLIGIDTSRYTLYKTDMLDQGFLLDLLKEVDLVVNFAAETHVDRSISDPYSFVYNNILLTCALLDALRATNKDITLVHLSTDEVYGDIPEGSFCETDRLLPSSPYAASKASSDLLCLAYYRTYGLKVIILRPTNNFGPYQFPEKLIPKTIIRAKLGLKVPIYGEGKNVRDWLYVLDTCEAIDIVARKGTAGEIYNISAGNELTNLELVHKILEIMGKDKNLVEFVEDRPGHDTRYSLDSGKIRKELRWQPKYQFNEALKCTIKWYLENEEWWKPLATEKVLHETPWKLKW